MLAAQLLIKNLDLKPHPEGGWYKQTYKSDDLIPAAVLPAGFSGDRVCSTAIFFLLEKGNFSAFHRIKSDECWHFYAGDPLEIFILSQENELTIVTLGTDLENGQHFQFVVPANNWFASRPALNSLFSFVGCTVAPGFEFDDFELAEADVLSVAYPQHTDLIHELCR